MFLPLLSHACHLLHFYTLLVVSHNSDSSLVSGESDCISMGWVEARGTAKYPTVHWTSLNNNHLAT